jgi:hypothetical protein
MHSELWRAEVSMHGSQCWRNAGEVPHWLQMFCRSAASITGSKILFHMSVALRNWEALLQTRRSRVRFPMRSLDFQFILSLNRTVSLESTQPLTRNEYQESSWDVNDNQHLFFFVRLPNLFAIGIHTFKYNQESSVAPSVIKGWLYRHLWADFVGNVEASTSQYPTGLHRLIQG